MSAATGNSEMVADGRRSGREVLESLKIHPEAGGDFRKRTSIRCALQEVTLPGDYAQFGVYRGRTARVIEAGMSEGRKLHLFDSFEGLPEDWTDKQKAGKFKLAPGELPRYNPEISIIHKGWFKDTVPTWAGERSGPLAFIHMDADLYSSTVDVLFNTNHLIVPGTILLFDEYVMRESEDEHRAFLDWAQKFDRKFVYLWRSDGPQVCVRVTA